MPTLQAVHAGARSLTFTVGRRGACLLFLAVLDLVYAFGLLTPTARSASNPTTLFLASVMPIPIWAAVWATVGLTCAIYAFRPKPEDSLAFALGVALKGFWGLVLGLGWVLGVVERGYLSTTIWGAFALFVLVIAGWRENNEH